MTATPSARGRAHRGRHSGPEGAHEPQPHDPEQYKTRNAVERGIGWLKATRYDPYAQWFLGFLYLAGAWIWLKAYLNTTNFSLARSISPVREMVPRRCECPGSRVKIRWQSGIRLHILRVQ